MRLTCTFLLSLLCIAACAQDMTGIWRGSFVSADKRVMDLFNTDDRYKYEVQIDQNGKAFTGVTYSYKTTVFYGKASANGTVNKNKEIPIKPREQAMIPLVLKNRENEVVQTLVVNNSDISIDIYDNGTIDHDTISVFLDKKNIVNHQMLKATPITVKLKMDEDNDYHELVMVADNLGDIPPNTSLMVVRAGDKRYEVRITSTEQKNAVVIFRYEKPGK